MFVFLIQKARRIGLYKNVRKVKSENPTVKIPFVLLSPFLNPRNDETLFGNQFKLENDGRRQSLKR